jgi:hypothetical protein
MSVGAGVVATPEPAGVTEDGPLPAGGGGVKERVSSIATVTLPVVKPEKYASPGKLALMPWFPGVRVLVVHDATPLIMLTVASAPEPSLNVTGPLGCSDTGGVPCQSPASTVTRMVTGVPGGTEGTTHGGTFGPGLHENGVLPVDDSREPVSGHPATSKLFVVDEGANALSPL